MEPTPTKRKAIDKKTRFEVFKRDSFKCQYCGQCAPDVILNVDHINPVSKGGTNNLLNYITACEDCNNGKSDRLLSDNSVVSKQRAQIEELGRRREQLEQMLKWRDELGKLNYTSISAAIKAWDSICPGRKLTNSGIVDLTSVFKKYGLSITLDAIESVKRHVKIIDGELDDESVSKAFASIKGIARVLSQPEWKRELLYIRGIARNRFQYVNESVCLAQMEEAYHAGVDIESIRRATLTTRSWTQWGKEIERMIKGT